MDTVTNEEYARRRKLWTDALRSGEYKQARGHLEKDGGFCCLGVGCKIAGLPTRGENGVLKTHSNEFRDWIGLRDNEGKFDDGPRLTWANDSGSTFAEIADIIDSAPRGLFSPWTF